jgi:hypothetical protein
MFIYLFNKMIINNLHIFYLFIQWLLTMKFFFFQPFYDSKFTCTYKNNIILFLKNYFLYKNIKIN